MNKNKRVKIIGILLTVLCLFGFILFYIKEHTDEAVAFEQVQGVTVDGQLCANQFGKDFFWAKLAGKKQADGSLFLMWILKGWPDRMSGVIIKRQIQGRWEPLVASAPIIQPGYFERDWKKMGLSNEQAVFYSQELNRYLSEKKIVLTTPQKQLEAAKKYGFGPGDGLLFMRYNTLAMLCGFGAIDNHPVKNGLYGLFGVSDSGKIDHKPFITWRNQPLEAQTVPLTGYNFSMNSNHLTLHWEIPSEVYDDYAITGFDVYRKENEQWKFYHETYRLPLQKQARFSFPDPINNINEKIFYKLVPKNLLKEPLSALEITYDPQKFGNLDNFEFLPPEVKSDHAVLLSWQIAPTDIAKIKYFRLERKELFGDKKITLADQISPVQPFECIDKTEKKYNIDYKYQLTAFLNNGSEYTTELKMASPVPQPKLPAPKNFKVQIVKVKEGEYKLRFSWDPVPGAIGYLFYLKNMADSEAVYAQQGGYRQETSFEEEYPASYQTFVYSYGIQALTANADILGDSELSVVENMQLLAIKPDKVEDVTYSQNAGEVSLSWKNIDPSTTELEIFINGESYQKLPPTATSITIPEIKKTKKGNKTGWVSIDIVNYNPMGKNKARCGFMYHVTPPEARKFPKIENFQGRYVEKDGQRGIELTWTPLDLKKLKLSGYDLTLYIRKGMAEERHSLCDEYKENHYFYAIPAEVSPDSELEFKIQATQAKREKWPPTILRGPWVSTKFVVK